MSFLKSGEIEQICDGIFMCDMTQETDSVCPVCHAVLLGCK